MNKISLVYPIFNPTLKLIDDHISIWKRYPDIIKEHLTIVIVDDYSTILPEDKLNYFDINFPLNFIFARITENKEYNIGGAKNLGMKLVKTDWALQTDIDHFVPEKLLLNIMDMTLDDKKVYRFNRIRENQDRTLEARHPHENSFLMNTNKFWEIGGYDEDMGGCENGRGFEDALLHIQMKNHGLEDVYLEDYLYEKAEHITLGLNRDHSRNAILFANKRQDKNYKNGPVIRFNWNITKEIEYV